MSRKKADPLIMNCDSSCSMETDGPEYKPDALTGEQVKRKSVLKKQLVFRDAFHEKCLGSTVTGTQAVKLL